jgi:hypothetical protein
MIPTLLLVTIPLVGCVAVFALPERRAVAFGVTVTALTLLDAVALAATFDYGRSTCAFTSAWTVSRYRSSC